MHRSVLATINLPRELIRLHSYIRCRPKLHPFRATVSKTVRPMLSDPFLSACPVCNVGVLWPNSWMDHDETCFEGRPRPWPYCVRWGPSSPSPNTQRPNFRPMSVVVKRRIKMPLGREIGLGPGDIVRWEPISLHGKGHSTLQSLFSPCLLWSNGCLSQQLLSSCSKGLLVVECQL